MLLLGLLIFTSIVIKIDHPDTTGQLHERILIGSFCLCSLLWISGVVLGLREWQNPVARWGVALSALGLLLLTGATVFPLFQHVRERA
jgi:uncharacterized membrane protein